MLKTTLFSQDHLAHLKQALTVYASRHRVIAENISNVETVDFRAQEFQFEEYLTDAQHRLQGQKTHPGHLRIGAGDLSDTTGRSVPQETNYDNGTNNVNIDREMTNLATNDLSYRLATRLLSMKYNLLRGAITGRIR